ncbi:hypothetical protein BH23VER1_BH23VER1_01910 [soil metagenome]
MKTKTLQPHGDRDGDGADLTAFALGELEGPQAEAIGASLASDPRRGRTVEEILEAASLLQNGFAREPDLFLTAEQRANVLRGRSLERPLPSTAETFPVAEAILKVARGGRRRMILGLGAAAAVLAIGVFVGQHYWDRPLRAFALDRSLAEMFDDPPAVTLGSKTDEARTALPQEPADALWPADFTIDYDIPSFGPLATLDDPSADLAPGAPALPHDASPARSLAPFVIGISPEAAGGEGTALWTASPSDVAIPIRLPARDLPDSAKFIPAKGHQVESGGPLRGSAVFLTPLEEPVSVINPDRDPTNYANLRYFLTRYGTLPPAELVSVGDLVNYFDYGYPAPSPGSDDPARATIEMVDCPWNPGNRLVRVGVKVRPEVERGAQAASRDVVLLIDASASMAEGSKLPMLFGSIDALLDRVGDGGQVAGIAYAGGSYFVLEPTPASDRGAIRAALASIAAPPAPSGADGEGRDLRKAVALAAKFFPSGGARVIAITDGSGSSSQALAGALGSVASRVASVDVVGLGSQIIDDQRGLSALGSAGIVFHHAGSTAEARRALDTVGEVPPAVVGENARLQVEFNPRSVLGYRLLTARRSVGKSVAASTDPGAASRLVGGDEVTAIYEIIPSGQGRALASVPSGEPLRYQMAADALTSEAANLPGHDEILTFRLSWETPGTPKPQRHSLETVLSADGDRPGTLAEAAPDLRFAAAVTGFGMLLGDAGYTGTLTLEMVSEMAEGTEESDRLGLRREFREFVEASRTLVPR